MTYLHDFEKNRCSLVSLQVAAWILITARQLLVDQICALAGGPCFYIGRDMKTSHAGLAITEQDWDINLRHTKAALDKHGIGRQEQDEFIELFTRYKNDIVEEP